MRPGSACATSSRAELERCFPAPSGCSPDLDSRRRDRLPAPLPDQHAAAGLTQAIAGRVPAPHPLLRPHPRRRRCSAASDRPGGRPSAAGRGGRPGRLRRWPCWTPSRPSATAGTRAGGRDHRTPRGPRRRPRLHQPAQGRPRRPRRRAARRDRRRPRPVPRRGVPGRPRRCRPGHPRLRQAPRRSGSAGPATRSSATPLIDFADDSRHASPWAAKSTPTPSPAASRHPHAVRILARAWIRVIWRIWQDGASLRPSQAPRGGEAAGRLDHPEPERVT